MRTSMVGMVLAVLIGSMSGLLGCNAEPFGANATLADVDRIRDDDSLQPYEKRDELAALGFSPTEINALLSSNRFANQFGGNSTTAYFKIIDDRLSDLTPDEIQWYSDAVGSVDDNVSVNFSDSEAQGIVDLFRSNGINTADDLDALLSDADVELPDGVTEEDLRSVFVDFNPDDVADILP